MIFKIHGVNLIDGEEGGTGWRGDEWSGGQSSRNWRGVEKGKSDIEGKHYILALL